MFPALLAEIWPDDQTMIGAALTFGAGLIYLTVYLLCRWLMT